MLGLFQLFDPAEDCISPVDSIVIILEFLEVFILNCIHKFRLNFKQLTCV
jgi:hypothetical protein